MGKIEGMKNEPPIKRASARCLRPRSRPSPHPRSRLSPHPRPGIYSSAERTPPVRPAAPAVIKDKICSSLNPKSEGGSKGKSAKFGRRGRGGGGGGDDAPSACLDKATVGAAVQACKAPTAPASCSSELASLKGVVLQLCGALTQLDCPPEFCSNPAITGLQNATEVGDVIIAASSRHARHGKEDVVSSLQAEALELGSRSASPRAGLAVVLGLTGALLSLAVLKVSLRAPAVKPVSPA
ncbi:hypothetical protein T492DRAFT_1012065 [Pavlovales sp. CCMP2436]|nr:hypothetical protein T492DRAFT_1012065 [Pavlovales sp. CCMP2436]